MRYQEYALSAIFLAALGWGGREIYSLNGRVSQVEARLPAPSARSQTLMPGSGGTTGGFTVGRDVSAPHGKFGGRDVIEGDVVQLSDFRGEVLESMTTNLLEGSLDAEARFSVQGPDSSYGATFDMAYKSKKFKNDEERREWKRKADEQVAQLNAFHAAIGQSRRRLVVDYELKSRVERSLGPVVLVFGFYDQENRRIWKKSKTELSIPAKATIVDQLKIKIDDFPATVPLEEISVRVDSAFEPYPTRDS